MFSTILQHWYDYFNVSHYMSLVIEDYTVNYDGYTWTELYIYGGLIKIIIFIQLSVYEFWFNKSCGTQWICK